MADKVVQRALVIRAEDGTHRLQSLETPEVLGPVDFGWRMQQDGPSLCIGTGILSGGVIPGSNRLIVCGSSSLWDGFYVSTMGGAGLLWDGLGISFMGLRGKAPSPSVLVLSGGRDREPSVRLMPVEPDRIWAGTGEARGVYALQQHAIDHLWDGPASPRVLATGPAARSTGMGAICSSRISKGKLTPVDCWAGRGGFGSSLVQAHNIVAIVYGGDFEDEDLTDRAEADGFFKKMFSKKMVMKDLEATTKYRYDPKWKSGGTFGVNYSKLSDWMLSFNYRSVNWPMETRRQLWERLVRDHYLAQFNEETIVPKRFAHCGEPCPAVCKKLYGEYKKDYEPYQTMGPLSGIFDQRAAESVNHLADSYGFDAIQVGGLLAWAMECLHDGVLDKNDLGLGQEIPAKPVFDPQALEPVSDSAINARIANALLDKCIEPGHLLSLGMREAARRTGPEGLSRAVFLSNGENGWMVPNQYWVPGMLAPMAVMGKYYVDYKADFKPPRELGRSCAERMTAEVTTDNAGMCRFHRGWSEKLWPEIVTGHLAVDIDYPEHHVRLARAIHDQGKPVFWESERILEMIHGYLGRVHEMEPDNHELTAWLGRFDSDRHTAAREYWDEMRDGIEERFRELAE